MAQGGETVWHTDPDAARAEALRRIRTLIAEGGDTLDFSDLSALKALPEEMAEAVTLRRFTAGGLNPFARGFALIQLARIDALSSLAGLRELRLLGLPIATLPDLSGLASLTALDLSGTQITRDGRPIRRRVVSPGRAVARSAGQCRPAPDRGW